jgi:urea ABC transporter permease protein UrtC
MLLVVLVPGLLAFVFGYFAFRSRIKGVYFSIITQALTFAFMLLFFRNETGFGGNNGFTDFKRILGWPIGSPEMRVTLFALTGAVLLLAWCSAAGWCARSSAACSRRSATPRARVMFSATTRSGTSCHLDALGVLCGVAGALYVPQVGIINPGEMSPANSIEIAIWVAVGGRGTLIGPMIGAFLVNGAKSWFTRPFPSTGCSSSALLFVLVTLFLPRRRGRPAGRACARGAEARTRWQACQSARRPPIGARRSRGPAARRRPELEAGCRRRRRDRSPAAHVVRPRASRRLARPDPVPRGHHASASTASRR